MMTKSKDLGKDIDIITDEIIGQQGSPKREKFEYELRMDILGTMIKEARMRKKLSQEQLGALIGVQKAQISKIENHTKNNRIDTIIRVLKALDMKVKLSVEYRENEKLEFF